jgi:hypothetical protein
MFDLLMLVFGGWGDNDAVSDVSASSFDGGVFPPPKP